MKILQINITYGVGSTGKIVRDIHEHLLSRGIESSVIYGRSEKFKHLNTYYCGSKFSLYSDVLLTRITGLIGYFSLIPTMRIIHKIKQLNPDIIHLHNIHGYYLNFPIFFNFIKKYNPKLVWTLHDEFIYTGKCAHSKGCEKFETECHHCPLIKDYPKSLGIDQSRIMHKMKKKWINDLSSLTVISTSDWLKKKLDRSFLKSFPRNLIKNGIDTSIFRLYEGVDNPLQEFANKFIVLSVVAKLDDPNKGFHIIQRLAEEAKGSELLFVVIGSKGKIANLPSNVINIPRTENQIELAKFYAFSDLYLMVSEFETYPTVTLEASAASLPILAFDAGGTKETIIGVQGKVLPYDSPDTLNEIYNFKSIIQSKNYKKVRNPQLDIIDKSKMIDSYISVYQGASS